MLPINQQENINKLNIYLESIISLFKHKFIFLFDADRTLCEFDTSRLFNDLAGIDLQRIKEGFVKHGYNFEGFLNNAKIYSELEFEQYKNYSKTIANRTNLYPGVNDLMNKIRRFADICIVTAGIKEIWQEIKEKHFSEDVKLLGGLHQWNSDFIIGKYEKGYFCDCLKKQGKIVFAFGDTDVDTFMLQKAHHAFIIVNHKNNWDLIPNLLDHKSLFQISFKDFLHPNIPSTTYSSLVEDIFEKIYSIGE